MNKVVPKLTKTLTEPVNGADRSFGQSINAKLVVRKIVAASTLLKLSLVYGPRSHGAGP